MSKPLKEDYIIRIKSRIEQHVKEPVEQEKEKEEFVELMTRGQFVQKGKAFFPLPINTGTGRALFIYASNEPKSVLARDLGDCRDNLRNSRSVFLIVFAYIS